MHRHRDSAHFQWRHERSVAAVEHDRDVEIENTAWAVLNARVAERLGHFQSQRREVDQSGALVARATSVRDFGNNRDVPAALGQAWSDVFHAVSRNHHAGQGSHGCRARRPAGLSCPPLSGDHLATVHGQDSRIGAEPTLIFEPLQSTPVSLHPA